MPRDGSGGYTLPANTAAVTGEQIASAKFNALTADLEQDANTPRPVVAGGTGAANAGDARSNLGISGNLYNITAPAYILTLLDDGDAETARATLGLGTAAIQNTGTSGAAVPLLNGGNTWSGAQTVSVAGAGGVGLVDIGAQLTIQGSAPNILFVDTSASINNWFAHYNQGTFTLGEVVSGTATARLALTNSAISFNGNTVWHAANDGAGSGMDADMVDGLHAAAFLQLAGTQTVTGAKTISGLPLKTTAAGASSDHIHIERTGAAPSLGKIGNVGSLIEFDYTGSGYRFRLAGAALLDIIATGLVAPIGVSAESSGALTSASANRIVRCSGNVTLPSSGMADGAVIVLDPRGTARTVSRPGSHMMYVEDSDVASAATRAHNVAVAVYHGSSKWTLHGTAP